MKLKPLQYPYKFGPIPPLKPRILLGNFFKEFGTQGNDVPRGTSTE
jgi:hypothetical protein